jgi:hypothetical protein
MSSCAWFTDFDSLSEPAPAAPDGAVESSTPADGGGESSTPASDASTLGDAKPDDPSVLFEDSFDDATPLPRGWSGSSDSPSIEPIDDAPSQPNALVAFSQMSAPVAPYLEKKVSAPGASAVVFAFRMKETQYGGTRYTSVARVSLDAQHTCIIQRHVSEAKLYCGMTGLETAGYAAAAPGAWIDLRLKVAATGHIELSAGANSASVDYTSAELGSIESATLQLGVVDVNDEIDWRSLYDDVKITRE